VHSATFIPIDAGFEMLKVMMVRVLCVGGACRERTLRRPGTDPAEAWNGPCRGPDRACWDKPAHRRSRKPGNVR